METFVLPALTSTDYAAIMPATFLSVVAMALLLINVFVPSEKKGYLGYLSLIALAITASFSLKGWGTPQVGFGGSVVLDNFAHFFSLIFIVSAGLSLLISDSYLQREECNHGEYYPLMLFATVGMLLMASGTDMMTLFLGLEVMSISLYVLAGFARGNVRSNEAGLKYFLLGAFSTGFLLYGMALLYGATGTTKVHKIAMFASQQASVVQNPMFVIGMMLVAVGFAFKIAAAPFHMWTPDVYEGAPTPVTAFMSAGPKAAGFAALLRVLIIALPTLYPSWSQMLWVLAVLTMTVGNITAIYQQNVKRMLAYSSIAHAGYALVGFVAANEIGVAGILFYLLTYAFMNIGAFAVMVIVGKKGEENNTLDGYAGLASKHPVLALVMSIFLFSLAGMPPTAGFIGKFYLFSGAIKAGYLWLVIIGVLNSAASVYYYLRVMVYMYMKKPTEDYEWAQVTPPVFVCILIAVVAVLVMGIGPQFMLQLAQKAISL